jgi:hypothetical protein
MVEMIGFRQLMWLAMLESAKDRILGVDPPRIICVTMCPVCNGLLTN